MLPIESLESRVLLSFTAHIDFQPRRAPTPAGYIADSGAAYGKRGNGYTYGWNASNTTAVDRNSTLSADQRYDTLIFMQKGGNYNWSIAVPNGVYQVHVVAGDPNAFKSVYRINAQGVRAVNGTPTSANRWVEGTAQVTVSNGRLTISNAVGASNNKIDFIDIAAVDPQTISFNPLPDTTYGSGSIPLSASSSSALPVSYSVLSGPATISQDLNGAYWLTINGAGAVTVRASQSGNASFLPAVSVDRSFTVAPAALTVTANDQAIIEGQALPAFTASFVGLVNGDAPASLGALTFAGSAVGAQSAGTYTIVPGGLSNANYSVAYQTGTLTISPAPAEAPAALPSDFTVFDATGFTGKPDLSALGLQTIFVAYSGQLFPPGSDQSQPDETMTRALARTVAALHQNLVIDIEHWPVDIRKAPLSVVQDSVRKLGQIADWVHDERPEVKLGFFGILPLGDYWNVWGYMQAVALAPTNEWWAANLSAYQDIYNQWIAANDLIASLAEKVDFICPGIYTFYEDQAGWKMFAEGNLNEAERYGKPVYPFVWFQYMADDPNLAYKPIPADYWNMELNVVRQHSDGVVIWGGWDFAAGRLAAWDEQATWWQVTQQFVSGVPATGTSAAP